MRDIDPLFKLFEQHLLVTLVEEEGTDSFLTRVVSDYIAKLVASGTVIPGQHLASVEADLRDEVLAMLRKKTYGHFSIGEYRKAQAPVAVEAAPVKKARRQSRAC